MLLFRSEDEVEAWCQRSGESHGESVPLASIWQLAQRWYSNRMQVSYRGRSQTEAEQIFRDLGLNSTFWQF